jgi:curved DNA-binding protein CbpA
MIDAVFISPICFILIFCRRLAMQIHPDKNPNYQHAEEAFKYVTQAYVSFFFVDLILLFFQIAF